MNYKDPFRYLYDPSPSGGPLNIFINIDPQTCDHCQNSQADIMMIEACQSVCISCYHDILLQREEIGVYSDYGPDSYLPISPKGNDFDANDTP